jgi:hypothetical protein
MQSRRDSTPCGLYFGKLGHRSCAVVSVRRAAARTT